MQYKNLLFLVVGFTVFMSCHDTGSSIEAPSGQWYKGNLHTHSYWSDGDEFPEMIMQWYKSHGYHFVALSDHNVLAEGEKWIRISRDSVYQQAFQNYLNSYGPDWVEYRQDSGHIDVKLKPFDVYRKLFDEDGKFLVIQSEEISEVFGALVPHMNVTNIQERIDPGGGNSVLEILQKNIDAVLEQRERTGVPMIPHVNHPNYGYTVSLEDMIALRGEQFFEVYNGHPHVKNEGDSTHLSTEEMWDLINISYFNNGKPPLYALATDDSHHYHVRSANLSNAGRGWIMVWADTLSAEAIIVAMEAGQFYASTGVTLSRVDMTDNTLHVEVDSEDGVSYTIKFIGCKVGATVPEKFSVAQGTKASFTLTEDIMYVRCKIVSSKLQDNPIRDGLPEVAWTQPVSKARTEAPQ